VESHGHEGETKVIRNANVGFKDGRPGLNSMWGRKVFFSELRPDSYGARSASCLMGTRGSILRVKQQGYEAEHSVPFSGKVKNVGAVHLFPIHLHGVLLNYIIKYTNNFSLLP
jgi:hypothetical protein